MTRPRTAMTSSVLTMILVACLQAGGEPKPTAKPTFLAIVRWDGALVPIAVHDGREWWNRWPWAGESDEEVKSLPVPATIDAIPTDWLPPGMPLPTKWQLAGDDGSRRTIRALRPIRPPGFQLVTTIALQTDLKRPPVSEGWSGEEPIGVAIAGPGELGRFISKPPSAVTRRILRTLQPRLESLELDAIASWRKERESNGVAEPVTLTRTYRGDDDPRGSPFGLISVEQPSAGRWYHYLDGEKLYKMGLKDLPDCKVNLSFGGVVVTDSRGRLLSEKVWAHAYAGYCGDRASWETPLATLRANNQILWICRSGGEDGYDYLLFDPTTNDPVPLKGMWQLRPR